MPIVVFLERDGIKNEAFYLIYLLFKSGDFFFFFYSPSFHFPLSGKAIKWSQLRIQISCITWKKGGGRRLWGEWEQI